MSRLFVQKTFISIISISLLGGCELLGLESPEKIAAQQEAEGKAIGRACRHGGRAIEDCYTLNPDAIKAAVFDGWKDMDEYMRENKIEPVVPTVPHAPPPANKTSNTKKEKKNKESDSEEPKSDKTEAKETSHKSTKKDNKTETENKEENDTKPAKSDNH